ncbi:hypothetical protein [Pseudoalteromonas luteoviolacea]|uniref:hypothetical protein n=1 Tax=Pseudoalteromonas luteoviolacea TaxID=43657 RepID=UPI0011509B59|nr:hypothetical protein [Pseudoalteromonas luteoviolacea]TQF66190.1 hypothetical protein FLM44_25545 [Pseudoalteromonas luteoviolacea]
MKPSSIVLIFTFVLISLGVMFANHYTYDIYMTIFLIGMMIEKRKDINILHICVVTFFVFLIEHISYDYVFPTFIAYELPRIWVEVIYKVSILPLLCLLIGLYAYRPQLSRLYCIKTNNYEAHEKVNRTMAEAPLVGITVVTLIFYLALLVETLLRLVAPMVLSPEIANLFKNWDLLNSNIEYVAFPLQAISLGLIFALVFGGTKYNIEELQREFESKEANRT